MATTNGRNSDIFKDTPWVKKTETLHSCLYLCYSVYRSFS